MDFKNLLSSKLSVLLLLILLVFLGSIKYEQWKSEKAIEGEKENLYLQEQQLQKKNQDLSNSLEFLKSQDFKERVAREQLNLKKEGEMVFTFSDQTPSEEYNGSEQTPKENYPQKWWNYFFKKS
jgi:cell division protein FtsB